MSSDVLSVQFSFSCYASVHIELCLYLTTVKFFSEVHVWQGGLISSGPSEVHLVIGRCAGPQVDAQVGLRARATTGLWSRYFLDPDVLKISHK